VTNHPLSEELFPKVQPELPLTQLHSISPCPVTGHQGEISSSLPTAHPEEAVGCVRSPFHLLQAEQTRLPQPLLLGLALEAFH